MKFNCFHHLDSREHSELVSRILGAFYARHPEVQKAVNYDSATAGYLTEKTKKMVRIALDSDAAVGAFPMASMPESK